MAVSNPTLNTTIRIGRLMDVVMERQSDPEERKDFVREFTTAAFIIIFGLTIFLAFISEQKSIQHLIPEVCHLQIGSFDEHRK